MTLSNPLRPIVRTFLPASAAILVLAFFASDASADPRRFVYSYEAQSYVPGNVEIESWLTWKDGDNGVDRYDFRHELEFGISERFRLSFYFADWRYEDGAAESFHDVAVEGIYNLTNPNTDWIGSSLYGEIKGWDEFLELEGKIILQKNFGPLAIAYNGTIEAEWEHEGLSDSKGEIAHTLGASYLCSQSFGVGAELLTEVEIDDWEEFEEHALYLGPNATFRANNLWLTVGGLWEITDTAEADFQLRTIFGVHF